MFSIGFMELAVIAVAALIFVGPKKLPQLMKQMGRFFVQIRRQTTEVRSTINHAIRDAENEILHEEREKIKALIDTSKTEIKKLKDAVESDDEPTPSSDHEAHGSSDTEPFQGGSPEASLGEHGTKPLGSEPINPHPSLATQSGEEKESKK
jgi:Tat protein translocase TatB subunit